MGKKFKVTAIAGAMSLSVLTGSALSETSSERTYDRSIEQAALAKLKDKIKADLRGTVAYDDTGLSARNPYPAFLDDVETGDIPGGNSLAKPENEPALKPMVHNDFADELFIDPMTTATVPKRTEKAPHASTNIWERFDSRGRLIKPKY